MNEYYIKKTSNGEYREIEKHFKLNVSKYVKQPDLLYFDNENEEVPFILDVIMFSNIMIEQIQKGLVESLEYKDGIMTTTVRDGNTIRKTTYDFSWNEFSNTLNHNSLDELQRSIFRIITIYNEDPNKAHTTEQKYLNLIYDIIDGDRLPKIDNKEDLLRIFEVYNAYKDTLLEELLENVVFFDEDGNVVDYSPRLRYSKLRYIKYDVLNQMEAAILLFIDNNDAMELYQEYLNNIYIPRREIQYTYVDEEGNEIEVPEIEEGTIFSLGKDFIQNKINKVLQRIRKN